mgnify:CR=1 FL=1
MSGRYRRARTGKQVTVSGVPVPFTFWPDAYVARGRVITSDPWSCFASHVCSSGCSMKRRNLALAFLEQAQDFYLAANTPRMGARSLLYYYSFMNLVKACLVMQTNLDLTKCIHGLREPRENIRSRLTITSQAVQIDDRRGNSLPLYREFMKICGFPIQRQPAPTKVIDLLEQIVGIHGVWSHTLKRTRKYFAVKEIVFEHDPTTKEAWISLSVDRSEVGNAASDIQKHMSSFEEVESPVRSCRRYECHPIKYTKSPKQVLRTLVLSTWKDIWSELRPGRYQWWITSINGKKRRAQLASGYQAMFFLGSVARYRPDDFYKLLESKHGWMLREFINTQPLQFIYFLGSGLIDAEVVVPELI